MRLGYKRGTKKPELNCHTCGYSLMGIVSQRCPECGASVLEAVEARDRRTAMGLPKRVDPDYVKGWDQTRDWSYMGWPFRGLPRRGSLPPIIALLMAFFLSVFAVGQFVRAMGGEQLERPGRSSRLMSAMEGAVTYGLIGAFLVTLFIVLAVRVTGAIRKKEYHRIWEDDE